MEPTFCEQCNRRTIDLFGGLCIDCHEELPGGSASGPPQDPNAEPTALGFPPGNATAEQNSV